MSQDIKKEIEKKMDVTETNNQVSSAPTGCCQIMHGWGITNIPGITEQDCAGQAATMMGSYTFTAGKDCSA